MTQLQLPDARQLEAQRPRDLMADCLAWIETHPEAWDFIVGAAQRDALDCGRVSVKSYIESLRRRRMQWATEQVKIPNAYSAPIGRILAEWYPDLRPAIPLAHSKLDGCEVPPRPEWLR